MRGFSELIQNLKKDKGKLEPIKLAVLGDCSTQLLTKAIAAYGVEYGYDYELHEGDYDQVDIEILNPQSRFHSFTADFVVIIQSYQKLLKKFYKLELKDRKNFASEYLTYIREIVTQAGKKVVYFNFPEEDHGIFGNFANKLQTSFLFQIRKLNYSLMEFSSGTPNFHVLDLKLLHQRLGDDFCFDARAYVSSDMTFSLDFLPVIAKNVNDIIASISGKFKKCIVLDLDNTLWGGVIGDDGMENIQVASLGIGKAFSDFQLWVKELKNRGIIVTVCSKNNEQIAKEPFLSHPEMQLRLEDISVFIANWDNKVDNIRQIRSVLNIGLDSMVFIDDNPFEREMVKKYLPEVCVPDLPEDPADFIEYLKKLNLFETASFTQEDVHRNEQYRHEADRVLTRNLFTSESEYLKSLDMSSIAAPFNDFYISRIAQLTQRSNQFNVRTIRYSEEDIRRIKASGNYSPFYFTLEDKFGDNGLIGVVILEKRAEIMFIDTWIMSCRVLKRGMESFVLNVIVTEAKKRDCTKLVGEYIPTPKNDLVRDHYLKLDFSLEDKYWVLAVDNYQEKQTFIKRKAE